MRLLKLLTVVAAGIIVLASFKTATTLTVTSSSFQNNGSIPSKYTCEGKQINPPVQVKGLPVGAKSLALILHDPDAPMQGGFTHWVMYNIPVSGKIDEDYKGADQGLNGAKKAGYIGMCPPTGTHHYHFMVYALDTELKLDKTTTDKAALEKAMQGHILAQGDLVGLYKKQGQ